MLTVSTPLLLQLAALGLMMGVVYALMAIGITFIASVMKMINWSMGEFYMIGSYLQFILLTQLFPSIGATGWWLLALPIAMLGVFLLGMVLQRLLLAPM